MKKIVSILLISSFLSACALFNDKQVYVPIKSSPSGASIYIDGKYIGETPTKVKLEPSKDYKATIVKKGYGSSNIDLETWYSVRGGRGADNARCVLDALGIMLVLPALGFYSVHCRDFKKPEYTVNIGRNDYLGGASFSGDLNLEIIDQQGKTRSYRKNNDLYNDNYQYDNGYYGGYRR